MCYWVGREGTRSGWRQLVSELRGADENGLYQPQRTVLVQGITDLEAAAMDGPARALDWPCKRAHLQSQRRVVLPEFFGEICRSRVASFYKVAAHRWQPLCCAPCVLFSAKVCTCFECSSHVLGFVPFLINAPVVTKDVTYGAEVSNAGLYTCSCSGSGRVQCLLRNTTLLSMLMRNRDSVGLPSVLA